MFGANKRLRDLGKETVDYTTYNTPSAKVRRYKQQMYGMNVPVTLKENKDPNRGLGCLFGAIAIVFMLPFLVPFFMAIVSTMYEFEETVDNLNTDGEVIVTEEENDIDIQYKYDQYDEEWVGTYYKYFTQQGLNTYDNVKLALADVNFDGVPEVFYYGEYKNSTSSLNSTYSINRIYYVNDYNDIKYGSVVPYGNVALYYSIIDKELMWLNPYESYSKKFWLYEYDIESGSSLYKVVEGYDTLEAFIGNFESTGYKLEYYKTDDFEDNYYYMVDNYLKREISIKNYMDNYS